ncbi:substrate-binding domain-containing protein, partial [Enterococcus faecium]|uniref:substrate-binding domain-containing protein n=1 Tax=Enterococcus faecium TaxID=1352 RepID=UPI003CC60AB8
PENVDARIEGFKSALDVYLIPLELLILLPTQFSKQGGYLITAELLDSAATGVFALNDELALGLNRGLEQAGKSIPED